VLSAHVLVAVAVHVYFGGCVWINASVRPIGVKTASKTRKSIDFTISYIQLNQRLGMLCNKLMRRIIMIVANSDGVLHCKIPAKRGCLHGNDFSSMKSLVGLVVRFAIHMTAFE
jgi:hypothetical protein